MPDFFKLLVDFSSQRQLPFLVIGGHAVNAYGYSRETADLDILVNKADRDQWLSWFHSLNYTIYRQLFEKHATMDLYEKVLRALS